MASTSNLNGRLSEPSAPSQSVQQRDSWSPRTDHAATHDDNSPLMALPPAPPPLSSSSAARAFDPTSQAGISLRAFLLGIAFGASFTLIVLSLVIYQSRVWRLPCFLSTLSLFHFLEFYVTARFNPAAANISAFLLSQNGRAYNVAHTLAFLECALRSYLWPRGDGGSLRLLYTFALVLGLGLTIVGQITRTMAMAHAGSNFNHLVQSKKKEGHVLVTGGIYAWLRHPSYFGFFWWGLGTQLVLGNVVCLVGYALVLWRFFRKRIESESALFRRALDVSLHELNSIPYSGRKVSRGFLWKRIFAVPCANSSRHTVYLLKYSHDL